MTNTDKKLFAEEYNKTITEAFNEFKSGNVQVCCSGCYKKIDEKNSVTHYRTIPFCKK